MWYVVTSLARAERFLACRVFPLHARCPFQVWRWFRSVNPALANSYLSTSTLVNKSTMVSFDLNMEPWDQQGT
jgi:hypothetical protein